MSAPSSASSSSAATFEFQPFQKIATDTSTFELSKKEANQLYNVHKWVVLEKVHGANFSIYTDGTSVAFAKRTGILEEGSWFYGYESIADTLREKSNKLFTTLKSSGSDFDSLIVYGELCGGFYPPHADKWKGALAAGRLNEKDECIIPLEDRAIQEGIYYSPQIEFVAFDICLVRKKELTFLSYDKLVELGGKTGLHVLKPKFVGSFTDCINTNYKFDSTVGVDLFGQAKLPAGMNVAEGVVICPADRSVTIKTKAGEQVRPLIKLKHPLFAEMSGEFSMSDVTANVIISYMVNMNRVNALMSKIGKPTAENFEQALDTFVQDVWDDYYTNYGTVAVKNYDETNQMLITKATTLLKKHWETAK